MRLRKVYILTFVALEIGAFLLLLGGCGMLPSRRGSTGFNHKLHSAKGITCDACHHGYDVHALAGMPSYATCFACHGPTPFRDAYSYELELQKNPGEKIFAATPRFFDLKFSHTIHAGAQVACGECHEMSAGQRTLEPEGCEGCHRERDVSSECSTCHTEMRKDRRPPSHEASTWKRRHGHDVAQGWNQGHENSCSLCHSQGSCDGCHQVEKPQNHTEYFRQRGHGFLVGVEREQCSTCHQESFCVRCHKETEPRSHRRASWGGATSNHCLECHEPLGGSRCSVCHQGAPSHLGATPIPAPPHPSAATDCYQCHLRPPHADNRMPCTVCHK